MARRGKLITNPGKVTETEQLVTVLQLPRSKRTGFFMAFKDSIAEIVMYRDLAAADLKVLFYMISQMGYDNVCELTITEISEALSLTRRICSRAVKRLMTIQAITPVRNVGRATFYMISPYISVKTKQSDQKRMIQQWDSIFKDVPPVLGVIDGRKSSTQAYEERGKRKKKSSKDTA